MELNIHYQIHSSLPLMPVLRQMSPDNDRKSNFYKTHPFTSQTNYTLVLRKLSSFPATKTPLLPIRAMKEVYITGN